MAASSKQKWWNLRAASAGRKAYKKARASGIPVKHAGRTYTREFVKIWKKSPDGRKAQTKWTFSLKKKAANRRFLYDLSEVDFRKFQKKQKNKCAICKKRFIKTPFVDHKKGTKICRGLLCSNCNFIIGLAHEDTKVLTSAITYLGRK